MKNGEPFGATNRVSHQVDETWQLRMKMLMKSGKMEVSPWENCDFLGFIAETNGSGYSLTVLLSLEMMVFLGESSPIVELFRLVNDCNLPR